MPWFAWIAVVAIVIFGITQVISMATGRPIPRGSADDEELETLRKRLQALEQQSSRQLEEPRIPTKAEDNLAAEDRWRLDMLEARLESLEKDADTDENGGTQDTANREPDDDEGDSSER